MIPSLLPLIAPPVRTWVRGPLGRRPVVADRAPASVGVRGPLGRRPTVDDRAPRECRGTRASGPTPCSR